jgi:DNA repair ATPase RecN
MQALKAKKDEEKRLKNEEERLIGIKRLVQDIYRQAIQVAGNTANTSFKYEIPNNIHNPPFNISIIANMKEIISELETLFPDCSVKHTQMAAGRDGKLYDLSSVDEKLRPLMNVNRTVEGIVVDWS